MGSAMGQLAWGFMFYASGKKHIVMKKCKGCQKEIDIKAKKCPHCQTDQRNWFMRHKILTGIGGIIGFFILVGIATSGGGGSGNASDSNSSGSTKDKIYAVNEVVPSGDIVWQVNTVKNRGSSLLAKDSRYAAIAKTKTTTGSFIELTFSVENRGTDLASITTPTLIDSQNREFTSSTDTSEWIPEEADLFLLSNLQPNLPKQFVVIYEVPAGATGLKARVGVLRPQLIDLGL
jgi:hypothetical protein